MRIPNTFGFDVKAAVYAEYHSVEELERTRRGQQGHSGDQCESS